MKIASFSASWVFSALPYLCSSISKLSGVSLLGNTYQKCKTSLLGSSVGLNQGMDEWLCPAVMTVLTLPLGVSWYKCCKVWQKGLSGRNLALKYYRFVPNLCKCRCALQKGAREMIKQNIFGDDIICWKFCMICITLIIWEQNVMVMWGYVDGMKH